MRTSARLPKRFPIGAKYVLDGRGPTVRRYIEFPNGRRVQLASRKALSCTCAAGRDVSIVPDQMAIPVHPRRRTREVASLPEVSSLCS